MQIIYRMVAENFVQRINEIWASEDTLKAEFTKHFGVLPFTRTDHWQPIVHHILRQAWLDHGPEVKSEPTGYDKMQVMRSAHPLLDYNLFTQVLLNLQNYVGMGYAVQDAEKELATMKEDWPKEAKLDPFKAGSKMVKTASSPEELSYNNVLSTMRAHKIIAEFSGGTSFRVSPKGSTPAFADSKNISMIGVGGDKYLRTISGMSPYYITWETTPQMITSADIVDSSHTSQLPGLWAKDISYPFFSKSGGEILQEVLFARKIMYEVFRGVDITQKQCIQIPRMNSVLIVTLKPSPELQTVFENLKKQYPMLNLWEGVRG